MRKLIFKFFSVFVSFANFFGNVAYSYDPRALDLTLNNARNNENVRIVFIEKIPNNLVPSGFHNVQKYCWLIGCEEEDLEELLSGKIVKGFADETMINDFMDLAKNVKKELEIKEEKDKKIKPCSICYKYLSKGDSGVCVLCRKRYGKKAK